jgi:hypothetical protein
MVSPPIVSRNVKFLWRINEDLLSTRLEKQSPVGYSAGKQRYPIRIRATTMSHSQYVHDLAYSTYHPNTARFCVGAGYIRPTIPKSDFVHALDSRTYVRYNRVHRKFVSLLHAAERGRRLIVSHRLIALSMHHPTRIPRLKGTRSNDL